MTETETCPEVVAAAMPQAMPARVESWTEAFTPLRLVLLIGACISALYPEVVLGTHSFFDRDFGLFTYPVVHYSRDSLWRGEIPLWTPLSNCGIPFLAQWNTTVCYPLSWFYFLLPLPWSLHYFLFAHVVIAGLGMYFLALRWQGNRFAASIGGLIYAQNGFIFNCLMWPSNLAALSWLPWVVLYAERGWREGSRWMIVAGVVGALQMLAGSPEITGMTWIIAGSLWLIQTCQKTVAPGASLRRCCGVLVIVIGLSAVQLLPFIEFMSESSRKMTGENGAWSLPGWGLANFMLPLFRTEQSILGPHFQVEQQWTSSYYIGTATLVLAVTGLARGRGLLRWWLGGLAFMGVLLALGANTPFYPTVAKVCPAITIARYPVKFVALAVFAMPLLASSAISCGILQERKSRTWLIWSVGIVFVSIGALVAISHAQVSPKLSWNAVAVNGATRCLLLALVCALLLWQARTTGVASARRIGFAVLLALGIDAVTHTPRQNPTVSNKAYGPLDLAMDKPKLGSSRAMVAPRMQALLVRSSAKDPLIAEVGNRRSLFENSNLVDRVPKVNGFYSLYLEPQADINALLYNPTNSPVGLMDFLSVTQISSANEYWKWEPRATALPLVTVGQRPVFASDNETLAEIAKAEFNPRGTVLLPAGIKSQVTAAANGSARILDSAFKAHEVTVKVSAEAPAMVVIAQTFSKKWEAFVDGQRAPLWRANHGFQAVQAPTGQHTIRLVYRDAGFYLGAWISALTIAVCGLWWLRGVNADSLPTQLAPSLQ